MFLVARESHHLDHALRRDARVTPMDAVQAMDDYRWLVGPEAARLLADVAQRHEPLVAATARLRKSLSAERAHLVLEQVGLRAKARDKFGAVAERMYFHPLALEQATDRFVARYKASRFATGAACLDLCCGIGGDLAALAERGPVAGIDCDERKTLLAEANCRVLGLARDASCRAARAEEVNPAEFAQWHLDPDRRARGQRTTRVEDHEPNADFVRKLLALRPDGALKLAPAAVLPDDWPATSELEWISRGGECRQLVVWFGSLARRPGESGATRIDAHGEAATLHGAPGGLPEPATSISRYLVEPDPAVLAANLTAALAERHGLSGLESGIGYLTGERPPADPLATSFEVLTLMSYQPKRIKALLRSRGLGRLEVKKRGVPYDPDELRRQLHVPGDESATLFITRFRGAVTAIIARRVTEPASGSTTVLPRSA